MRLAHSSSYDLEEIRSAVGIPAYLETIGHTIRKTITGWRGPCPLCGGSARATKFTISRDGNVAKCHACDWGGDLYSLIKQVQSLGFLEAVGVAAELAGIERVNVADKYFRPISRKTTARTTTKEIWNDLRKQRCTDYVLFSLIKN